MPEYNHAAAFAEFCRGASIEEISHALAIPLDHLKRWRRDEKWDNLIPALSAPSAVATSANEAERALEKIRKNREKNFEIAQRLQEDLLETVQKLRSGELKTIRVFANGLKAELEPSLRDRADLALYAKNVAELSYRALGDVESAKNTPADSGLPSAGQITIVLPPPIAEPRQIRAYDVESEVVAIEKPALAAEGT